MKAFPFVSQSSNYDCSSACVKMIARFNNFSVSDKQIDDSIRYFDKQANLFDLKEGLKKVGINSVLHSFKNTQELEGTDLPLILHWKQNHFVVLYRMERDLFLIADPAAGKKKVDSNEFTKGFFNEISLKDSALSKGHALFLKSKKHGESFSHDSNDPNRFSFRNILSYFNPYKSSFFQLSAGLILLFLIQLIIPFLSQTIVDFGIKRQNLSFIYLAFIAQLVLAISRYSISFLRSWTIFQISTKVNIKILSDFLEKILEMPLDFFNKRNISDILQRMGDHKRIESFVTNSAVDTLFSLVSFTVYCIILSIYSLPLTLVFFLGSILYLCWSFLFYSKRRLNDYGQFELTSEVNAHTIETVSNIYDVKINCVEKQKKADWVEIQKRLNIQRLNGLKISQAQNIGGGVINEAKNLSLSFLSASFVISGELTLGMMIAVQYMIGQMNQPVNNFIGFIQGSQDAKISLERISNVYSNIPEQSGDHEINETSQDIVFQNAFFRYSENDSNFCLNNVNLTIPGGKTTSIVGSSGSGKSTLLKIILKFYSLESGSLTYGGVNFQKLNTSSWRKQIGAVLQESQIMNESIIHNITLGNKNIAFENVRKVCYLVNILDFIESLPLGFATKIGSNNLVISSGQKQRILLARSLIKDPDIIVLDEATNSLDISNEKIINERLFRFLEGKTVINVTHNLNYIKNSDQIVVMENGYLKEIGTHDILLRKAGAYKKLVNT